MATIFIYFHIHIVDFLLKFIIFVFLLQGAPEHYQNLPSQNLSIWALVPVPQQVPERVQIQVQTALIAVQVVQVAVVKMKSMKSAKRL